MVIHWGERPNSIGGPPGLTVHIAVHSDPVNLNILMMINSALKSFKHLTHKNQILQTYIPAQKTFYG